MGARWSPSFPRQSLARRRARNIVQVHAHALNGSWECYHVVRIGLGAIWGDHGRRRSLHFTTPPFCLKKGWVYPLLSISQNNIPLSPCVPENLVSRGGFNRPVPRQPAHLHTQAEPGAYLRDSSRVPRRRPFMKPPYAIGSVPSSSGHAIAYRWRSLPRVRRHRAIKPQGSSERVLPWQITTDQLIFASLSHTHYWYV